MITTNTLAIAEGKQRLHNLAGIQASIFDDIAARGETVLIPEFIYTGEFTPPVLRGGWVCLYIGGTRIGTVGQIVLLPHCERTSAIWRSGQLGLARKAGLTEVQAYRWLASRSNSKHALLPLLAEVLLSDNTNRITDYLAYDLNFSKEAYWSWRDATGIAYPKHPKHLKAFCNLLREVLEAQPSIEVAVPYQPATDLRPWEHPLACRQ